MSMDKIKVNLLKSKARKLEGTRAEREKREEERQSKMQEELGEWKKTSENADGQEPKPEDMSHIKALEGKEYPKPEVVESADISNIEKLSGMQVPDTVMEGQKASGLSGVQGYDLERLTEGTRNEITARLKQLEGMKNVKFKNKRLSLLREDPVAFFEEELEHLKRIAKNPKAKELIPKTEALIADLKKNAKNKKVKIDTPIPQKTAPVTAKKTAASSPAETVEPVTGVPKIKDIRRGRGSEKMARAAEAPIDVSAVSIGVPKYMPHKTESMPTEEKKKWKIATFWKKQPSDQPEKPKKQEGPSVEEAAQAYNDYMENMAKGKAKTKPEVEKSAVETPEAQKIEKEIENLSQEEKEKIGWSMSVWGFKAEKIKDDILGGVFNKVLKKVDKDGATGRFCIEARDYFVRNGKDAVKKANDASAFNDFKLGINIKGKKRGINISAKRQRNISNIGAFSGNVLKYGRLAADVTGLTVGAAHRIVMALGMATAMGAEMGKEARLKGDEVREKTWIADADKAAEEAWEIYKKAEARNGNISAESLKKAYMLEMPKDILKRLENPTTGNRFMQKIIRWDLENALLRLNKNIEAIEKNFNLSPEQKGVEKEKLITSQKKNLEDYDRIITQYGTVEEMAKYGSVDTKAMVGYYGQKAGKAAVATLQVETLFLLGEKLLEISSHFLSSHDIHPIEATEKFVKGVFSKVDAKEFPTNPTPTHDAVADLKKGYEDFKTSAHANAMPVLNEDIDKLNIVPPSAPGNIFTNEGIKFEHGKGGIQGVLDLKNQIRLQYKGDFSQAPQSVQDFMKETNVTQQAIKLGLYDPNSVEESALIQEGSVLKFDEQGNILFGKPDASGNVPVLEKYTGRMFDSDHSVTLRAVETPHAAEPAQVPVAPAETAAATLAPETYVDTQTHIDTIKENIQQSIDAAAVKDNIVIDNTVRMGTTVRTGTTIGTGNNPTYGQGPGGTNVNFFRNSVWPQEGNLRVLQELYYPDLSPGQNDFINDHLDFFGENIYHLSGQQLLQAYDASVENINFLFAGDSSVWMDLKDEKAGDLLKYVDTGEKTAHGHMAEYLRMLKIYAGFGPKNGILGYKAETTEQYIARAMQNLAGKGKLEEFNVNIRK